MSSRITPKHRVDSEFVRFVNEYAKVMTENFAQGFVDHRNVGIAPQTVAELSLHHAKGGFDVRPLVVMLHKLGAPELKIMEHFGPCFAAAFSAGIGFERDKRRGSDIGDSLRILSGAVPFIGGNLANFKILRGAVNHRRKKLGIARIWTSDFYGGVSIQLLTRRPFC